jgi:hypothetical protein
MCMKNPSPTATPSPAGSDHWIYPRTGSRIREVDARYLSRAKLALARLVVGFRSICHGLMFSGDAPLSDDEQDQYKEGCDRAS